MGQHGVASGPVRSPPLLLPQWHFVGQRTGPLRRKRLAFLCARRRFLVPSVAAAAGGRAPATTPGTGVAAGPPGRGLCAWIHAPARTPAVLTGCHTPRPHHFKFTLASKHQWFLPRQLSAEILARAFAPRRATSGLVRIPPASGASGGESRSLGKGITPQKYAAVSTPKAESMRAGRTLIFRIRKSPSASFRMPKRPCGAWLGRFPPNPPNGTRSRL